MGHKIAESNEVTRQCRIEGRSSPDLKRKRHSDFYIWLIHEVCIESVSRGLLLISTWRSEEFGCFVLPSHGDLGRSVPNLLNKVKHLHNRFRLLLLGFHNLQPSFKCLYFTLPEVAFFEQSENVA